MKLDFFMIVFLYIYKLCSSLLKSFLTAAKHTSFFSSFRSPSSLMSCYVPLCFSPLVFIVVCPCLPACVSSQSKQIRRRLQTQALPTRRKRTSWGSSEF
jgi:hypothetical protein